MISRDLAEAVLNEQNTRASDKENSELAAALIYARKKSVGPYSRAHFGSKYNQTHLARLTRNGFDFDIAKQVLALPSADAADELLDKIYPHQLAEAIIQRSSAAEYNLCLCYFRSFRLQERHNFVFS